MSLQLFEVLENCVAIGAESCLQRVLDEVIQYTRTITARKCFGTEKTFVEGIIVVSNLPLMIVRHMFEDLVSILEGGFSADRAEKHSAGIWMRRLDVLVQQLQILERVATVITYWRFLKVNLIVIENSLFFRSKFQKLTSSDFKFACEYRTCWLSVFRSTNHSLQCLQHLSGCLNFTWSCRLFFVFSMFLQLNGHLWSDWLEYKIWIVCGFKKLITSQLT